MKRKRHKRNLNQVMLVTSESGNADVKQYKWHPVLIWIAVVLVCVLIGAFIGYLYFEKELHAEQEHQDILNQQNVQSLLQEKKDLEDQIASLNETIQILSETVNQKTQIIDQMNDQTEKRSLPTGFPLSKSATMQEAGEGEEPACTFVASAGAMVIATGAGTVMAINDDNEFGHNIWIDHGNGYYTVYRNSGEIKVKQGEKVSQGNTLFLIGKDNVKLEYQMLLNGDRIDPMDMLEISG